jgi:hypothetical protein
MSIDNMTLSELIRYADLPPRLVDMVIELQDKMTDAIETIGNIDSAFDTQCGETRFVKASKLIIEFKKRVTQCKFQLLN